MPSSSRTSRARLAAAGMLVALLTACTSEVTAEEDPERALEAAVAGMSDYRGIDLRFAVDGDVDPSDLAATDVDAAVVPLLLGSALEVRSSASEAAHARIAVNDDPAAKDAAQQASDGLAAIGLGRLGETLADGDWIRISTRPGPQDAENDRIAVGLAEAMQRLVERSSTVTHEGGEAGTDRLRLSATEHDVQVFVAEVVEVISFTADGGESDGAADRPDADAGIEAAVDLSVNDGHIVSLTLDGRAAFGAGDGPPLPLRMDLEELDDPVELPDDALAFSLRGLLRDLVSAAASGAAERDPALEPGVPAAPDEPAEADEPATPRQPTGQDEADEPDPLREGGVLDEAFGDENPFEGGEEFECVTEEDLALLGEALGEQAVDEVEELLERGLLVRC